MPVVVGDAGSTNSDGVQGFTAHPDRAGVIGVNNSPGVGVRGVSEGHDGVQGIAKHVDRAGVIGVNTAGVGVRGSSEGHDGVQGIAKHVDRAGVIGVNTAGVGVRGSSEGHDGVQGITVAAGKAGVVGVCDAPVDGNGVLGRSRRASGVVGVSSQGVGVLGQGGRLAGLFQGDVEVTGDIRLLGADCAEDFDIAVDDEIDPGTVLVISEDGLLRRSSRAYDHRVAGVVSGADGYRPGLILDNRGHSPGRRSVALLGKVYCKVDATAAPINVGSLLTTSDTPGHAMRATDQSSLAGAVLGKALRSLHAGYGLIPILVALQ
jgi:hypothetical protein